MPLRIALKAGERLIVGNAVVRNGDSRCALIIENDVPILRGKEVLSIDDATSPCRRIYFAIQLLYVDREHTEDHQKLYWQLVREVLEASPSMGTLLTEMSDRIGAGQYYQALKLGRKLIAYEEELISHVAHR
ncbi:MAG: flagellar biosynthesis repressor FlbT [Gemmatimonadales bacterium]